MFELHPAVRAVLMVLSLLGAGASLLGGLLLAMLGLAWIFGTL